MVMHRIGSATPKGIGCSNHLLSAIIFSGVRLVVMASACRADGETHREFESRTPRHSFHRQESWLRGSHLIMSGNHNTTKTAHLHPPYHNWHVTMKSEIVV